MSTQRTYSEALGPAMNIVDQAEADRYFEKLVVERMAVGKPRPEAEDIVRSDLGYYAGYYDDATRARVERLFRCAHPVFGSIAVKGPPSPKEAFEAGLALGEAARRMK